MNRVGLGLRTYIKDNLAEKADASPAANPKHLKFKELDPAQLPRSLDDVDVAVINNNNYAQDAGLSPAEVQGLCPAGHFGLTRAYTAYHHARGPLAHRGWTPWCGSLLSCCMLGSSGRP